MTFEVSVQTNARKAFVAEDNNILKAYLTRPARDGQANAQLVALLAEYFKVKKYQICIVKGLKSRKKLICIDV
ncbi:MAG: DUF167 domain-containing protein [Candidatus Omnitrophota bacterium]|jgi:uncharacterized protein (TIGR00251 family)|nr:MAG: DUF167 domain-containing protein [Candidatus Omnitrophota bacterium]